MEKMNNVHVSGNVLAEKVLNSKSQLEVGIETGNNVIPITAIVKNAQWEKFKKDYPDRHNAVTISGQLQILRDGYVVQADSITCFHNILQDELNESGCQFHGRVRLKKKFDFDTKSNLFLKRLILETDSAQPVRIEAMALRGAASSFEEIEEGQELFVKANLVMDNQGDHPPYWRIDHQPECC